MSTALKNPTSPRSSTGGGTPSAQRSGNAAGAAGDTSHMRGEYLTFRLGHEEYGIDTSENAMRRAIKKEAQS